MNRLYPNLARLLVVRTRFLADCDFLRRMVRLGEVEVHPRNCPPGEEIETVVARRYGIDWFALKAERALVDSQDAGEDLGPADRRTERVDFVRTSMEGHCLSIEVTATPLSEEDWLAEADRRRLPPGHRARGWTDVVAGGTWIGEADPVEFLFCPELMARSTADLPLLMPAGACAEELLASVEGYLEIVAHVLDVEVSVWETEPDAVQRRTAAEDAVATDLGPAALRVLFTVQASMVDERDGIRDDLTGDDEWTDVLDPDLGRDGF